MLSLLENIASQYYLLMFIQNIQNRLILYEYLGEILLRIRCDQRKLPNYSPIKCLASILFITNYQHKVWVHLEQTRQTRPRIQNRILTIRIDGDRNISNVQMRTYSNLIFFLFLLGIYLHLLYVLGRLSKWNDEAGWQLRMMVRLSCFPSKIESSYFCLSI